MHKVSFKYGLSYLFELEKTLGPNFSINLHICTDYREFTFRKFQENSTAEGYLWIKIHSYSVRNLSQPNLKEKSTLTFRNIFQVKKLIINRIS